MSLATLAPAPFELTEAELEAYLPAVAAAGFAGVSVWPMHLDMTGKDVSWLSDRLAALELRQPIVEAAFGWLDADEEAAAAEAERLCEVAAAVGAKELLAVTLHPELPDMDEVIGRFRRLADRAGESGLGVSIEFLPWTGIADLATAWRIVEGSGCANAGIMLDAWHWQRQPGGPDLELLRSLPAETIRFVQLCDATAQPDGEAADEAMRARLLPGEGVVDFEALLGTLDDIGAEPVWFPEVFNTAMAAAGAADMAAQVFTTCREVLAAHS